MSCLCTSDNITDLGCFCYCNDINTGILASMDGTYVIEIKYLDGTKVIELELLEEEEIVLEFDKNENYEYIFSVTKPNNETSCYQFKTQFCV